jgi:hypothetical protein
MARLLRRPTHEVPEKFTGIRAPSGSTMKRILELLQKCPGLSFLELVDLAGRGSIPRHWWPSTTLRSAG